MTGVPDVDCCVWEGGPQPFRSLCPRPGGVTDGKKLPVAAMTTSRLGGRQGIQGAHRSEARLHDGLRVCRGVVVGNSVVVTQPISHGILFTSKDSELYAKPLPQLSRPPLAVQSGERVMGRITDLGERRGLLWETRDDEFKYWQPLDRGGLSDIKYNLVPAE